MFPNAIKTTVLMLALGISSMTHAAPAGGHASSPASSAAAPANSMGAGRVASGGTSAPAAGASARSAGGGMHGVYRAAPELDPKRRISEQDCTKAFVRDGGNLRCK